MSRHRKTGLRSEVLLLLILFGALISLPAWARTDPPEKPKTAASSPDVIVFTNGDRLTGKLVRAIGGNVTFHSDVVGDVTVPWSKVKQIDSRQSFAVIQKNEKLTAKNAKQEISLGAISVEDNKIQIHPEKGTKKVFPANSTDYVVDATTLQRELQNRNNLFYGWTGNITVGASLVQATNTSQTYTGTVGLLRTIPTVSWLPTASRTSLNLSGTYGLLTQPEIVSNGNVVQTASIAKTNILHGDMEYDRYLSPRAFWLAAASADHNFGSGLELQHTYGLGFGLTAIKQPNETLDLKTNLHYEQQQFYNGVVSNLGTPDENLIGADLSEIWMYTFAHGIKINQNLTLSPAFNVVQAYSAVANANLIFPVYKRLNFTLSSTDNYLGDPPSGYQRNTFQFTAGITYVIK